MLVRSFAVVFFRSTKYGGVMHWCCRLPFLFFVSAMISRMTEKKYYLQIVRSITHGNRMNHSKWCYMAFRWRFRAMCNVHVSAGALFLLLAADSFVLVTWNLLVVLARARTVAFASVLFTVCTLCVHRCGFLLLVPIECFLHISMNDVIVQFSDDVIDQGAHNDSEEKSFMWHHQNVSASNRK